MSSKKLIELKINGENYDATVSGSETLLTLLRDQLDLTGTKRGCNQGVCGACTVIKDGVPVRSCLTVAGFCNSSEVTTVEGLAIDRKLSNLQNAFSEKSKVSSFGSTGPGMPHETPGHPICRNDRIFEKFGSALFHYRIC